MSAALHRYLLFVSQASWKRLWPWLLLFGLLWYRLIDALHIDWSVNPQYSYGWVVPFLALYVGWNRWQTRPLPQPPTFPRSTATGMAIAVLAIIPLRFIQEANTDWRALLWYEALGTVGATLCVTYLAGGWAWLRHFLFPVGFIVVAIPWPVRLEQLFTQELMQIVASIGAEGLSWCGIPAWNRGNLIELTSGTVGVDEACSGVRSAQSTFMATLFMGELLRLSIPRRLGLIGIGALLAFCLNVIRAFSLAWITAIYGPVTLSHWHDPAGYTVLIITFLLLWLLAQFLDDGRRGHQITQHARLKFPVFVPHLVLLLGGLLVAGEVAIESWYQTHAQPVNAHTPSWRVRWPSDQINFQSLPIYSGVQNQLRFNTGEAATWDSPEGGRWCVYFLAWNGGRNASQLAHGHRPDVCLPASGRQLVANLGIRSIPVRGIPIPFGIYVFEDRQAKLYVFDCVWQDGVGGDLQTDPTLGWSLGDRWETALAGHRDNGYRILQVGVWGFNDVDSAQQVLASYLDKLLVW